MIAADPKRLGQGVQSGNEGQGQFNTQGMCQSRGAIADHVGTFLDKYLSKGCEAIEPR